MAKADRLDAAKSAGRPMSREKLRSLLRVGLGLHSGGAELYMRGNDEYEARLLRQQQEKLKHIVHRK